MTQDSDELHFFYDAQGKPAVVVYNGTAYAYVKNLQGDIVAVLDGNGTAVVQYKYDAWGRQIDCTFEAGNDEAEALSTLNPFRYRGYVYDEETGLYYLQTRYYSPENVRFLNADIFVFIGRGILDSNVFAYCLNSPVFQHDAVGTSSTLVQTSEADLDPTDDHENFGCGGGGAGGGTGGSAGHVTAVSAYTTPVLGGPHGSTPHKEAIRQMIEALKSVGQSIEIWANCKMTTAGLIGGQKPDIIALSTDGYYYVWEFASCIQATGTKGCVVLQQKIDLIWENNPKAIFFEVPWEAIQ